MGERPVLFPAPMVRAILAGAKTQTRRVITPQPSPGWECIGWWERTSPWFTPGMRLLHPDGQEGWIFGDDIRCPFGVPGDRLWVRETWQEVHPLQVTDGRYSQRGRAGIPGPPPVAYRTIYRADGHYPPIHTPEGVPRYPWRVLCAGKSCQRTHITGWRPSIHMPRWASRITLEITDVRVERLQDITEEDARAEGVKASSVPGDLNHRGRFRQLWDDLYAVPEIPSPTAVKKRPGCSWADNPWVWAVTFRRVEVAHG